MKLNKIKTFCKNSGQVLLYDTTDGRQIISDGAAYWPVTGITLSEDALRTIFEMSSKAWSEKISFEHIYYDDEDCKDTRGWIPERLLAMEWDAAAETQMEPVEGRVEYLGKPFKVFASDDDKKIIVPDAQLRAITDDAHYYMIRKDGPYRMLAVYDSVLLAGLVTTLNAITAMDIVKMVRSITEGEFI